MSFETGSEIPKEIAKRRKHWLLVTVISAFYPIIYVLMLFVCYCKQISPDKLGHYLSWAINYTIVSSPFVYFLYHCAYKKFGNVYLVLSMIGSLVSMGYTACSFSKELPCFFNSMTAITILLGIYWFIVSRDLFKLNQVCRKIKGIE